MITSSCPERAPVQVLVIKTALIRSLDMSHNSPAKHD